MEKKKGIVLIEKVDIKITTLDKMAVLFK